MPTVSDKQRKAMAAAADGRSTIGIPREIGKEYMKADKKAKKAKKVKGYAKGGRVKTRGTGAAIQGTTSSAKLT